MTKQVVTVQLGTRSNFLATHFWNLQYADLYSSPALTEQPHQQHNHLEPTVFFRESSSRSSTKPAFTPRVQIVDASGAFGALCPDDSTFHDAGPVEVREHDAQREVESAWQGPRQVFVRDNVPQHRFTRPHSPDPLLSNSTVTSVRDVEGDVVDFNRDVVSYWSDYLAVPLHRRACHPLNGIHHEVTTMQHFATGAAIAEGHLLDSLYDDGIRRLIEECDSYGGALFVANADDAYAGIAASFIDMLRNDVGASPPCMLIAPQHDGRICSRAAAKVFGTGFSPGKESVWARSEGRLAMACAQREVQYVPVSAVAGAYGLCREGWGGGSIGGDAGGSSTVGEVGDYRAWASVGLALHASLSGVTARDMSLGRVIGDVRKANAAVFSSMVAVVPRGLSFIVDGSRDILHMRGVANLSNVWTADAMGAIGIRVDKEGEKDAIYSGWRALALRRRFLTARGLQGIHGVKVSLKQGVVLPDEFPDVLEGDAVAFGDGGASSVAAMGGIVDDRCAAAAGLRGMREAFDVSRDVARLEGLERLMVDELKEDILSWSEDLEVD